MAGITQQDVLIIKQIYDNKEALVKINQTVKAVQDAHQKMLPTSMRGDSTLLSSKTINKAINDIERKKKQATQAEIQRTKDAKGRMLALQRGVLQGGLSIMFFGMMMQRFFQGIAQSSLTTFNKLNADTAAANNTMNRLGASIEGVRYAIGDAISSALEPMEGALMNIIDKVIDFIDTHPQLVTWGIAIGLVVGAVMALVGQFALLIIGLAATKMAFGGVSTGAATSLGASGASGSVGLLIAKFVALGAILIALFGIFTGDESILKWVSKGVRFLVNFVAQGMLMFKKFMAFINYMGEYIAIYLGYTFKVIGTTIRNVFANIINWVIDGINKLIEGLNKVANSKLGKKLRLGSIGPLTGKMEIVSQDKNKNWLDSQLADRQARLDAAYSAETAQKYMDAVEVVMENFNRNIAQVSYIIGTNSGQQYEAWNKQVELYNKESAVADVQLDASDKLNLAAEKLLQAVSNPNQGAGSTNASYQNGQIFYGFSTQM